MRRRNSASVRRGWISQTPTIIIRLASVSMRSQAVSTRDMRSVRTAALIGWSPAKLVLGGSARLAKMCLAVQNLTRKETSMADLKARFEKAVADSKSLPEKPDTATLLQLYALYKQASSGDVDGKRPGFTDMVGRAKWDAWNEIKGKDAKAAMQEYVDLIESMK